VKKTKGENKRRDGEGGAYSQAKVHDTSTALKRFLLKISKKIKYFVTPTIQLYHPAKNMLFRYGSPLTNAVIPVYFLG